MQKNICIFGGGTTFDIRSHLSLAARAYGATAHALEVLCNSYIPDMKTRLFLTKMADQSSPMITNKDVEKNVDRVVADLNTKIIFFSCALCDYEGQINGVDSGKYADRLKTDDGPIQLNLTPAPKVINKIRGKDGRKDIFLVGFKTTSGVTEQAQYMAGLNMMKRSSCNLVLANDVTTRLNMIITPEEAKYCITKDRMEVLTELVKMTNLRSQLTFTRSTVVKGDPVPWQSDRVPATLRTIVDYCVKRGAYKVFNGATVGHFAAKIGPKQFLTSRRKTNFNDIEKLGLVLIETDGPDSVIAYGSKPSVGGQSQRIVFENHSEADLIVHFHCPIKKESKVPTISQREYECGSHACGKNTSDGLRQFGNLKAVYLDNHGPNIVFHHSINPQEVINFIEANFDLKDKTGGTFT